MNPTKNYYFIKNYLEYLKSIIFEGVYYSMQLFLTELYEVIIIIIILWGFIWKLVS